MRKYTKLKTICVTQYISSDLTEWCEHLADALENEYPGVTVNVLEGPAGSHDLVAFDLGLAGDGFNEMYQADAEAAEAEDERSTLAEIQDFIHDTWLNW